LVVSRDVTLLQTRRLILGTFFRVQDAARMQEAEALLAKGRFELIILCQSLTDCDCQHMANLIRNLNPRPLVLALKDAGMLGHRAGADDEVAVATGPYGLLKKCAAMLNVDLKAKVLMAPHTIPTGSFAAHS